MIITFVILIITIAMFIWGKFRADFVAVLALIALYLFGILDTEQALSGFSDSTVIMIAALFIVGDGLARTGVSGWIGNQIVKVGGSSETRLVVFLLLGTALIGAFISNTGTVAMMLPIVVAAAWRVGSNPSKFLLPLAFVANVGGLLTLVSTPPNIVVTDILVDAGFRPFGFFEFSFIGIPLLIIAIGYMIWARQRLLPERKTGQQPVDLSELTDNIAADYALAEQVHLLRVRYDSSLAGQTLAEARLGQNYKVSVLKIEHVPLEEGNGRSHMPRITATLQQLQAEENTVDQPGPNTTVQVNDMLIVKGKPDAIKHMATNFNLGWENVENSEQDLQDILFNHEVGLSEIVIAPRSRYIGQTITEARFADKYNVQVLSILRRGDRISRRQTPLAAGDVLLIRATWDQLQLYKQESRNFIVIGSPEATSRQVIHIGPSSFVAIFALLIMIGLMLTGWVTPVMATLIAAAIMILGRSLTVAQATDAIVWNNVILLAALLPLSIALQVTGGAELIADGIISIFGQMHYVVLLGGIFLLTTGFTQVISNTAATVLIAPIALQVVLDLGYEPHAFLMIVAVAAATGFLTPFGTSTNLMVMTPGGYKFGDYSKFGLPLLLIIMVVSLILVPLIWSV